MRFIMKCIQIMVAWRQKGIYFLLMKQGRCYIYLMDNRSRKCLEFKTSCEAFFQGLGIDQNILPSAALLD
jgi:hypothetical protein